MRNPPTEPSPCGEPAPSMVGCGSCPLGGSSRPLRSRSSSGLTVSSLRLARVATAAGAGTGFLNKLPHPVTLYCKNMLTTLDPIQYTARPLGKLRVQNPNMIGSIHDIMLLMEFCRGSVLCWVVIFWTTYIDPPTSSGMRSSAPPPVSAGVSPRSIPRNVLFRGIVSFTRGSHDQSFPSRLTSPSGVSASAFRMA